MLVGNSLTGAMTRAQLPVSLRAAGVEEDSRNWKRDGVASREAQVAETGSWRWEEGQSRA